MVIYWSIFLVIVLGTLLSRGDLPRNGKLTLVAFAATPCVAMLGFRWGVGPDFAAYFDIFKYSGIFSFVQSISREDPGYFTLMWAIHRVQGGFWAVNFICGFVFISGLTAFSLRQPNPWLSVLVAFSYLVLAVAMSGNRQSIALGLLFFAINCLQSRKTARFILLLVIASLFHGSAILMIPICLLAYSNNSLQFVSLLVAALVMSPFFLHSTIAIYMQRYSSQQIQSTGVWFRLAMNGLAAVIFLRLNRRFSLDDYDRRLWRIFSWLTLALFPLVLLVPSSTAVDRFLLYLFPLQFMVASHIPFVASGSRNGVAQMTLVVMCYAFAVQFSFLMFGSFASGYVPYESIFSATQMNGEPTSHKP